MSAFSEKDVNELFKEAGESGDYTQVISMLEVSDDPNAKALAKKMKTGMTALMSGAYASDAGDKKEKAKEIKEDKK